MHWTWCPAFTWGAKKHLHKCCMTSEHKGKHFCVCGAMW